MLGLFTELLDLIPGFLNHLLAFLFGEPDILSIWFAHQLAGGSLQIQQVALGVGTIRPEYVGLIFFFALFLAGKLPVLRRIVQLLDLWFSLFWASSGVSAGGGGGLIRVLCPDAGGVCE